MSAQKNSIIEEEFDIPLDINDILLICSEYNKLGYQIQNQIEIILNDGVDQSIQNGDLKKESLPHIKAFLKVIVQNPYFGDAAAQANDCILLIEEFETNGEFSDYQVN